MSSNDDTTPGNPTEETTENQTATEIPKEAVSKEIAAPGRSPSSNSSGSNAESLSAYAERTVATIVQRAACPPSHFSIVLPKLKPSQIMYCPRRSQFPTSWQQTQ